MKFYQAVLFILLVIQTACTNNGKKQRILSQSVGNINALQVIITDDLWNGVVGEAIRDNFAAPADGLPQDEPLYTISQLNPENFSGFARKNRLFLYVALGEEDKIQIGNDLYAKPQSGAIIRATSEEKLIELIDSNAAKIMTGFYESEIKERQRRTALATLKIDSLKNHFGVDLTIPSAYRIAIASDSMYWFRKDLSDGTTNILIYNAPLSAIQDDSTAVGDIIKIRDSIGSRLLPVEDDGLFITEDAYAPYLFLTEVNGKFAYETKGTWEIYNAYMGGPFINYAIRDEENNRYLILEGFTYAPAVRKRNLQFELESILKTAKLK